MEVHFEDTTVNNDDSSNNKKAFLSFINYKIDDRFIEKIPATLKENVKGGICELAKLCEPMGYLLESVNSSGEYLTKVNFSIPSNDNKHLIIAFSNKGAKENWVVSSIRIEKAKVKMKLRLMNALKHYFIQQKKLQMKNNCISQLTSEGRFMKNGKQYFQKKDSI